MASQPSQIDSLQAGRAFAALAVVLHHAALATRDFAGPFPGMAQLEAGYLGVDFFFVLSGFIIYHSSQGKSLGRYASARIRRVYLPYLPVGIGIALLYLILPQLSAGERSWSWLPTLTLLPVNSATALSVAWTLKHEILFYALFAVFFFTRTLALGLAAWAGAIVAASFLHLAPNVPLSLINLEFLFGIGVAIACRRGWGHPLWYLVALGPLVLWLWLGAQREDSVLVGLAFAAMILPTVRLEREGRLRVPPWLLLLGAASYSIYLVHGVAISVMARMLAGQHWWLVLLAAGVAGTAAGLAYHRMVERPLLRMSWWRRDAVGRTTSVSAAPNS